MAVPGRKPKPEGQTRHRNRSTVEWVEVPDVPFITAPKLPAKMPNGMLWPAATRRWWSAVSSMPHCVMWTASDWEFAFGTAFVAGIFHATGSNVYAAELRHRERALGTTSDSRRDLRIRYVDPKPEVPTSVTNMDDYRDL